ncbi:MAG: hypothetical protein IJW48_00710 [Clostridia bacterium]|nr:hypothetical protein [Clostridia bacterium]
MSYLLLNKEEKRRQHECRNPKYAAFDIGFPLLDISDRTLEDVYYFRWQTYSEQIKMTPRGFVVTEFLPEVSWAGKYNTINCPATHHFYEGRWLHNRDILRDYARFWVSGEGDVRKYSFPLADSVIAACRVWDDYTLAAEIYGEMKENYAEWEKTHGRESGLFYQIDNYDGMEFSISGNGERPTINSYMYADAAALAEVARRIGNEAEAAKWQAKAERLRELINERLWDSEAEFYKNRSESTGYELSDVREEIGYIPWLYHIPEKQMSSAWKFLNDENHFYAPYGPTTAERCHPRFMFEHTHMCLWNGPSWPFSTCQTLGALANLLRDYEQGVMTKADYYELLHRYAACHYIERDGVRELWIDENLDPFTGEWLARKIMIAGGRADWDRGVDYNHSTFCDLVISGLAGVSLSDGALTVEPLFTESDLSYLCLDGVKYGDKFITVVYDRDGKRYGRGVGLSVFVDGELSAHSENIERLDIRL